MVVHWEIQHCLLQDLSYNHILVVVLYLLWTLINIGYILENKWGFTLHNIRQHQQFTVVTLLPQFSYYNVLTREPVSILRHRSYSDLTPPCFTGCRWYAPMLESLRCLLYFTVESYLCLAHAHITGPWLPYCMRLVFLTSAVIWTLLAVGKVFSRQESAKKLDWEEQN